MNGHLVVNYGVKERKYDDSNNQYSFTKTRKVFMIFVSIIKICLFHN